MTPSLIAANGGEKVAQFVEAWEAPERNILLRHVASPIVSSIAIETLSVLGVLYHSLGVLVKSTPAAMELVLRNLPMQWTKNIARRFPAQMTWNSFTSSFGALGIAIKGAIIGGLQTVCLTGRAQCIRSYSAGIFSSTVNRQSIGTRLQKVWHAVQSNVAQYKSYYALAGVVASTLGVLAFMMRPLSREQIICNIAKDLEKKINSFPEEPREWKMQHYCQVVDRSTPYYEALYANSNLADKKIQEIQQAVKEANPQYSEIRDWATCSIRDRKHLRLLMRPLTTAFKSNSNLPCQSSVIQRLQEAAVAGYRSRF